jgi:hypothetical protein
MDPKNLFGQPLHEGEANDKTIQVPMDGEFGVFVALKTPYGVDPGCPERRSTK